MKEVFKTLSLASVLCSQVSMTPSDLSPQASNGSENITAVEGEDVIFRSGLTLQDIFLVSYRYIIIL